MKCYFSKNHAASSRQNPHVYFLTALLYMLLMGHFFADSVLQSITKDWGKRCEWEHPAAFGLGVIRASSQVFYFFSPDEEQWYFLLFLMELLQLSSSAYARNTPEMRRKESLRGRVCVQSVRYAFTSVIKCWIRFKHIYQIGSSHLQLSITKSATKSVFTGSFVC